MSAIDLSTLLTKCEIDEIYAALQYNVLRFFRVSKNKNSFPLIIESFDKIIVR
jgi:hypothetical protein